MINATEYITIDASPEKVFDVINNYEAWPSFLSVNKKVIFIKQEGDQKFYEVFHEKAGGILVKSLCIRKTLNKNHISFQLKNKNFKILKGDWIMASIGDKTMLISIHEFIVNVPWLLKPIKLLLSYFIAKRMFFDKTTPITLNEIKKQSEK